MYCTLICLKMSRMSPTAVILISRMVSLLISSSTSSAMLKKKLKKKNIRSTVKKTLTSRRSKIPLSPSKIILIHYLWLEINHFEVERGKKKIERKLSMICKLRFNKKE